MERVAIIGESASDKTGDGIVARNARWSFGGDVAGNFDSHVSKSVPLYDTGHDMVLSLSDYFVKADSVCYELGSSTGALIAKLAARHSDLINARFIGLDIEESMVMHAKTVHQAQRNLEFRHSGVEDHEYEKSDLIVSYYTIQFIHPKKRQKVFDNIYESLEWGGAFILFEKVRANDARFQDIITTLYDQFKLDRGYSPEEVVAKKMSLKGIMEPFSSQANYDFLTRAGFNDVITIQKYLCFEGFLSIK